ncbi:tryptophan-rich sensory protein [bacterium]|nr:tryptophan-rich sensory protein [bacterium]
MRTRFGPLLFLVVCTLGAGFLGSLFPPGEWYAALAKPAWNPPGWVFGPVWAALYVMMAIAAWLVWSRGGFTAARGAMGLYLFQLILNALWSFLFFGLQRPDLAFVDVVLLWLAILATLIVFARIRGAAGMLLIPYLAWVGFAVVLHLAIWRLNA